MAQSAPPPPPIRMGMRIAGEGARSGLSAGHARSVGGRLPSEGRGEGGAGTNPITKALGGSAGDAAGFVPTQDVPIRGLGTAILNLALHPTMVQRAEEEQTRLKNYKENNPDHAAVQDAADSYMQARAQGGSNADILGRVFSPDSQGHVHFTNPAAFSAVMGMHNMFSQAGAQDQASAPPSIQKMGDYNVFTSGGKSTVLKPASTPGAGKYPGKTFTDQAGNLWFSPNEDPTHIQRMGPKGPVGSGGLKYDSQGNVLPPQPGTAEPQGTQPSEGPGSDVGGPKFGKAGTGKLTTAEEADVKGVEQFATALRNYEPVSGSNVSGLGAAAHLAPYFPWAVGKDFKALEEAHGQLQASATALANSGNLRLKQIAGAVMGLVPPLGSSQDYAQNFAVPGMRDKLRTAIGSVNEDLAAKNMPIPPALAQLTQAMGASPAYLAQINSIRDKMTTAPGSMTNQDVDILNKDNLAYRTLNRQQQYALQSQMGWRGYLTPDQVTQLERQNPGFKRAPTQAEDPHNFGTWQDPAITRAGIEQQKAAQAATAQANPLAPAPIVPPAPPTQAPLAGPNAPPPPPQSGMPQPQPANPATATLPPAAAQQPPAQPAQQPSPGMAAPIPPATGMAPQPPRQSLLDQINPISSAMASEPPVQAPLEPPGNPEAEILAKQPLVDQNAGKLPSELANVRATAELPPPGSATAVIPPKEKTDGDQSEQ